MADEQPVDLTSAWFWTCPNCRAENFVRPPKSVDLESLPDDELRELLGLEPWQDVSEIADGSFDLVPERVACHVCLHQFVSRIPGVDPDDGFGSGDAPPTVPDALPPGF